VVYVPTGKTNFEGGGAAHCKRLSAVICAKTAEPIEMPFGSWAGIGPRNHVVDGGPDSSMGRGNYENGKDSPFKG